MEESGPAVNVEASWQTNAEVKVLEGVMCID